MPDLSQLHKIKTLNDIKLEKARLRYEIKAAETRMHEGYRSVENMVTIPSIYSKIIYGFEIGQKIAEKAFALFYYFRGSGKKKKKKKKKF